MKQSHSRVYIQQYDLWWSLSRNEFVALVNLAISDKHYSLSPYRRLRRAPKEARHILSDDAWHWEGPNVVCPLRLEGDDWESQWLNAAIELGFKPLAFFKPGDRVNVLGNRRTIIDKQGAVVLLRDASGNTTWCPGIEIVYEDPEIDDPREIENAFAIVAPEIRQGPTCNKDSAMKERIPTTLLEAVRVFGDERAAWLCVVNRRWPDGIITCPRCGSGKVRLIESRLKWTCNGCARQFSAKIGTIFEESPLPFSKWLPAMWLIANAKNGISSCELARGLGVTQKTAWFMLHRVRLAFNSGTIEKLRTDGQRPGARMRQLDRKAIAAVREAFKRAEKAMAEWREKARVDPEKLREPLGPVRR